MANTLRFKRGLASGIPTALAGEPLFTTDTFDLYIGNGTTNTRFQKYIASGATTQILRGDGSLYTFPLAISSPSAGQVLKYNGTSWVNDSDAGITGSGNLNYITKFTPSGTAIGNSLLFDNGNTIGFGITPSNAWGSDWRALQIGFSQSIISYRTNQTFALSNNAFHDNTNWKYFTNNTAALYAQIPSGDHFWSSVASGTAGNNITFTQLMTLKLNGNLLIGSTTDSGEKLQVTGTMKVTGATSIDGTTFNVDATNDRVGIGTATPSYRLHIAYNGYAFGLVNGGTVRTVQTFVNSGGTFDIGVEGSAGGSIFTGASAYASVLGSANATSLQFATNATVRATLDASGNLGLAVTPSAWRSAAKAFQVGTTSSVYNVANGTFIGNNVYSNSTPSDIYIQNGHAGVYGMTNVGTHIWGIAPSGTAGNAITFTQAMTLDASGNLLLGSTTSSGERLQVTGTAKFTSDISLISSANAVLTIDALSTNTAAFIFKRSGTEAGRIAFSNSANMIFHTGSAATQRMVIDGSTGAVSVVNNFAVDTNTLFVDATNNRVGILTTSPSYGLHVQGTGYFNDNLRFPNLKGVVFVQSGGSLLGSISMDSSNQVTIDNNGFFGLSVGSNYNLLGGNTGIGTSSFGTSATRTFAMLNGTAPSSSPVDSFQLYSNDVTAGNAAPHFRTENGAVIKLYQETTAVGNAIISLGGGNAVLDDTTFDGYTLRQLVRALRNQGILQ